jgi:hypothetical protein
VRTDLCTITSDRRLLQQRDYGPEWVPCSIVREMVRKLVMKTWMFLDAAAGE